MALDMETISLLVEETIGKYNHPAMKSMPERTHFQQVASCYGDVTPGQPLVEQLADAGRIIAVLYWKLAQARGYVSIEESA